LTLVLDAGALIAVERGDRATVALIEAARRDGRSIVVPAGVVGQTWRDGARQAMLARVLGAREVSVEPLTDALARAAGELCNRTGTADVIDASVVVAARRYQAVVLSSDRGDLSRLDPALPIIDC
jgi:PIN domain